MVYCGKPSKGCSNCRERKIRCDQRDPGCGQCEKRQQQCPGYRNMVDLMFRDESSHVIKKATRARSRRKAPGPGAASSAAATVLVAEAASSEGASVSGSPEPQPVDSVPQLFAPLKGQTSASTTPAPSPSFTPELLLPRRTGSRGSKGNLALLTPASESGIDWNSVMTSRHGGGESDDDDDDLLPSPDEGTWPSMPMSAMLYTIAPSFQERGMAYFFSRYVAGDDTACHQNYDFIYDIWKPVSMLPDRQVDGVLASMTAVGLAGLSVLTRCPQLMDWARCSYGTALRLTNNALRNAREAVKDSTMLSVLILGTYEMLTGRTPQTVRAWQEHVHGAAALAKMRGAAQFGTTAGIRMFMMSHQTVMIACMQQDMPMPQALVDLRDELGRLIGTGEPGWRIPEPIYKALQVRYDVHNGLLTEPDVIISKLAHIDQECAALAAGFPEHWTYYDVGISRPNRVVLGNRCHVYPSLLIANAWNGLRTIRMLIHESIIGEIFKALNGQSPESMSFRHKEQLARSIAILRRVRDAIIASIPQHFGVVSYQGFLKRGRLAKSPSSPTDPRDAQPTVVLSPTASSSSNSSAGSRASSPRLALSTTDFSCPTILDALPTNKGSKEGVEHFMTIASASHTVVWPLYLIGMASCCTDEVKEYAVERLLQIHHEGNLAQAGAVAAMIQQKDICCPWGEMSFEDIMNEESSWPVI